MVVSHILTMNDCNLRVAASGRFSYVVHVDLDEFLVPRQLADYSLLDLIRRWDGGKSQMSSSLQKCMLYVIC